ncbi:MAG: ATP citrate lyase citrate-binding domain-containing protein [Candidatus Micrarchaeota archaeon]|nr:ATPase [Candidatus Micrarchaeota archaeon]MBU1886304.1 ATPase [Candidatus Micrarchaeota archaeon]
MARKKIREHDAKQLLSRHLTEISSVNIALKSVQVTAETNLETLAKEHQWLNDEKLVVKPDMLFGKRGKHNLVLLNANFHEAQKFIKEKLGKEVEISGVKGFITHFIVEPFVPHNNEYYLSIVSTREGCMIHVSATGGMEVEENWDKMAHISLPIDMPIDQFDFNTAIGDKLPNDKKQKIIDFVKACYKVYLDLDFSLLEMNPFTFDPNGNPFPLDMRGELDDTSAFKNMKKWGDIEFPKPFGRTLYKEEQMVKEMDEKTGASLKLTLLNPQGHIWMMVAGGGASVIYTDTVVDLGYGAELGNYGEYSGDPNEEETYQYASVLLDLATRNPDEKGRALLIGGGIANFTDVANTFKGIIRALKDYKQKLIDSKTHIYVRRGGPNYQTGLKLMRDLGKELGVPIEVFGPEASMTKIVPMAINYVKDNNKSNNRGA